MRWLQEGTPNSLVSTEAEQEEASSVTAVHTQLRPGEHLPKRRALIHRTCPRICGHRCSLLTPLHGGSKNPIFLRAFFPPLVTWEDEVGMAVPGWGSECLGTLPKSVFPGKVGLYLNAEMQSFPKWPRK